MHSSLILIGYRRREGRQQLAAKRRMDQQRRDMDMKKEVLQKFDEKKDLKSRLLEEKQREEREKQRMRWVPIVTLIINSTDPLYNHVSFLCMSM